MADLPMPKRDIFTPSVKRYLVAGSDVEEDAIHELVKVIFENRLDLAHSNVTVGCHNKSSGCQWSKLAASPWRCTVLRSG